jgi:single-stranded DNA-binding protein
VSVKPLSGNASVAVTCAGNNSAFPVNSTANPCGLLLQRSRDTGTDSENQWREKTQWHDCVPYGELASAAATVKTSAHLLIEGHLVYREYERRIETESGPVNVQWPVTEIVVDSLVMLDRKTAKHAGAAA